MHKVAKWADIVTAHSIPGEGIIKGLRNGARDSQEPRGVVLISSMSTEDALIDENGDYEKRTYAMAYRNRDFVMGFISQRPIKDSGASDVADFITMTPGVSISSSGDELGQKYRTPQECILEVGSDVIIVGRAIIESIDPVKEARKYRELGWEAYRRKIII